MSRPATRLAALAVLLAFTAASPGAAPRPAPTAPAAAQDAARLRVYHDELGRAIRRLSNRASLLEVLRPIMQLAGERSAGGDPAVENRAAILVMAMYALERDLGTMVPEARDWPRPQRRSLRLRGRNDLARHYLFAAAISSSAGGPLAAMLTLLREIDDSRRGSGFSFADLAANRTGARFGSDAVSSPDTARRLLARLLAGAGETDIMPDVVGLPEGLGEAEFARRYGDTSSAAYRDQVAEIDRRIDALPLFRGGGFWPPFVKATAGSSPGGSAVPADVRP